MSPPFISIGFEPEYVIPASNICVSHAITIKLSGLDDLPMTVADMAALLSTVDIVPLYDLHLQHSILLGPQAVDTAGLSGSNPFGPMLLPLPGVIIPPITSSTPLPDPHMDDIINPLYMEDMIWPCLPPIVSAPTVSLDSCADDVIDPLLWNVFNPADGASSIHTHLPPVVSAPIALPDLCADDVINPLLWNMFNPADGASSVHTHVGTHPSITAALSLPSSPIAFLGSMLAGNLVSSLVPLHIALPPMLRCYILFNFPFSCHSSWRIDC